MRLLEVEAGLVGASIIEEDSYGIETAAGLRLFIDGGGKPFSPYIGLPLLVSTASLAPLLDQPLRPLELEIDISVHQPRKGKGLSVTSVKIKRAGQPIGGFPAQVFARRAAEICNRAPGIYLVVITDDRRFI